MALILCSTVEGDARYSVCHSLEQNLSCTGWCLSHSQPLIMFTASYLGIEQQCQRQPCLHSVGNREKAAIHLERLTNPIFKLPRQWLQKQNDSTIMTAGMHVVIVDRLNGRVPVRSEENSGAVCFWSQSKWTQRQCFVIRYSSLNSKAKRNSEDRTSHTCSESKKIKTSIFKVKIDNDVVNSRFL